MSVWSWGTWVAIVVLVGGSLAVFVWFCFDLVRLNRATRADAEDAAGAAAVSHLRRGDAAVPQTGLARRGPESCGR